MSRRATLGIIAAVAVGSTAVGWVAGQQIQSPADIAAAASAPEASLITVAVEERELSSNVVIRGQVEFSESTDITVGGATDGVAIITATPKAEGDVLAEGDVAIEVAGRPVIMLQGTLPVFRSLTPGLEGPDVEQLEAALVRLGLDPGTVDEVYTSSTEAAVSALYKRLGYTPNEPTLDEIERIEQARRSVRNAQDVVRQLESTASASIPQSTLLELDRQVTNAEQALTDAQNARNVDAAPLVATQAQAIADREAAAAAAASAAARLLQAQSGVHPDTALAPTPAELAALQSEAEQTAAALTTAETAEGEATAAIAAVDAIHAPTLDNLGIDLQIAQAIRSEQIASFNDSFSSDSLTQARESLSDERTNLSRLEAEIGVSFPGTELVFLPVLPAEIQAMRVEIGEIAQGPVMTVTGSGLQITSSVSAADRSLLEVGTEAIMEDSGLGLSVPAVISFIANNPGGLDTGADRYAVRLEPVGEVPEEAINQNLRVTIPFASTDGPVLAVPLAALSAGADGSTRVEVERSDGTVEVVAVVAGLNARALGLVEITPVDGRLEAGDRVVVGRDIEVVDGTNASTDDESTNDESTDDDGG